MIHTEKCSSFRNIIVKLMGLFIAPFAFSAIIYGIVILIANTVVGDIIGYGNMFLLNSEAVNNSISQQLQSVQLIGKDEQIEDTVHITEIDFPVYEEVYGEISIENADILCPLVYGDTEAALKKGAGQYIGSTIIGYGGTSMICAHVNRQFANLHEVEPGDTVQIRTTYGVYTYEVKYVGVHSATDDSIYDLAREDENIVLYTCYYQYTALGSVKKRFFVCADYVSGPMIIDRGGK